MNTDFFSLLCHFPLFQYPLVFKILFWCVWFWGSTLGPCACQPLILHCTESAAILVKA